MDVSTLAMIVGFVLTIGAVGVAAGKLLSSVDNIQRDVTEVKKDLNGMKLEVSKELKERLQHHHYELKLIKQHLGLGSEETSCPIKERQHG